MAEQGLPVVRGAPLAGPETLIVAEVEHTVAGSPEGATGIAGDGTAEGPDDGRLSPEECQSPSGLGRSSPAYERLEEEEAPENSRLRNYKQGDSLGRGAYGEVFKAMVAGRFMAVKKIPMDLSLNPRAADKEINALLLEINTLKRLKHRRIVRYHGCIREGTEIPALLIFLEFMPSGSIKGVLSKFGPYNIKLVRKYTRQILEGLDFLHSEKIVHRDVKGANILIDAEGDAKLADFGACRELEALQSTVTGGLKSIHGSVYWMAPEVMKYKAGRRSDIWSLGCTVIEMLTAEAPWKELRQEKMTVTQTLKYIVEKNRTPTLPEKISSDCRSFLGCVLERDYNKRPYADQLLKHHFVATSESKSSPTDESPAPTGAAQAWATPAPAVLS